MADFKDTLKILDNSLLITLITLPVPSSQFLNKLKNYNIGRVMAERVGFEPTVPLPGQLLSRQPDSAALAPLQAVY